MSPVGRIALGLTLVLADLRIGGLDVVPDVLGWVLVVAGLGRLGGRGSGRWRRVRSWAVVTGVLSLADLVHPQVTTTQTQGSFTATDTVAVVPDGLQGLLVCLSTATSLVVVVLLSLALRDAAREHDDRARALTFGRFAVLHAVIGAPGLALSVYALVTGAEGTVTPRGVAAAVFVAFVLAVFAFEVWFIAAVARTRHLPWLQERDVSLAPAPSSPEPSG
jgi:hypothetical protein